MKYLIFSLLVLSGCAHTKVDFEAPVLTAPDYKTKDDVTLDHNACGGNINHFDTELYLACMHKRGYFDKMEKKTYEQSTFLGYGF